MRFIRKSISVIEREIELSKLVHDMRNSVGHNIFVFGSPYHSNLGDQAQSYCIERWASTNYPGHRVWVLDTMLLTFHDYQLLKSIRNIIAPTDRIFLHSGYHTTDLYMLEEKMQRKVVTMFPDMRVVILPQTIYYQNPSQLEQAKIIYNAHPDLHLLCRDDVSYETALQEFPDCHPAMFPDIVTTMIGAKLYTHPRKGIFLCVRNDKEAFYSKTRMEQLRDDLASIDDVTVGDTTVDIPAKEIIAHRGEVLEKTWDDYSKYRLIVTDRYHGTIFSLVAGTPVLVLSSSDHKLSSGVKWFPPEFSDYVKYIPDIDDVPDEARRVYSKKLDYVLPPYFQDKYYSKLKQLIVD
ncbi:polysaccharide pyruvyl transferase family protein [Bifidobacterium pullorum subsp. saeculare]|uniref:Polysaccharide pyruvyl transferase family protein n=1 Tax=Bifidobacterium pullorum subsp. saeculare TaxID=78257 RepID=A0A938WXF8_9BIFI|nr:polysaccharide pyruvyl transferase family protein [Bifidobacterium pullorum]MBM6699641.1 polysaccharide pyruvyl transferase family protein [Bifidobacterium pullorum subsp. saeculare]